MGTVTHRLNELLAFRRIDGVTLYRVDEVEHVGGREPTERRGKCRISVHRALHQPARKSLVRGDARVQVAGLRVELIRTRGTGQRTIQALLLRDG